MYNVYFTQVELYQLITNNTNTWCINKTKEIFHSSIY